MSEKINKAIKLIRTPVGKRIAIVGLMVLLMVSVTADYANAANSADRQENQPASLLLLDTSGNPSQIFGNKNIDWDAIGLSDKTIKLTEYEQYRLNSQKGIQKLKTANEALEICRNYGIIDQNTNLVRTPSVYDFTCMIARVFYQNDVEFQLKTSNRSIPDVCKTTAEIHGFLLDGNWTDNPDMFPLTKETMNLIACRLLQDFHLDTTEINKLVPNIINFETACQFIVKLAGIINPAPPLNQLIYSEYPVIPIIIKPVPNTQDSYHNFKGTSWEILNNDNNRTGFLSNNKPINEANVLELLRLIEQAFPSGTVWTAETQKQTNLSMKDATNNGFLNAGPEVKSLYLTQYNVSTKSACGGFASFVSDILFGHTANPIRKIDNTELHPGDLLLRNYKNYSDTKTNGKVEHTAILTTVNNRVHAYDYAEGNFYNRINWNNWRSHLYPEHLTKYEANEPDIEFCYYTRWPE